MTKAERGIRRGKPWFYGLAAIASTVLLTAMRLPTPKRW